jgi:hypothetical protein
VRAWLKKEGFQEGDLRSTKFMASRCSHLTPFEWAQTKGECHVYEWLCDNGGLVPYEEQAVRAWLKKMGFPDGDLRRRRSVCNDAYPYMHPMGSACDKGELNVCKWLHDHGAAPDITKVNGYIETPMHVTCRSGHLLVCKWLCEVGAAPDITKTSVNGYTPMHFACGWGHLSVCKWLFEVGAAADITKATNDSCTPMYMACYQGHLPVCKWLFEVGGAADIAKANNDGITPMFRACQYGHLSVCEWLFEVGAAPDITKANNKGATPMYIACQKGELSVCKWLFKVGAAADITKANNDGTTPMSIASQFGHLSVRKWLVFNGALNTPPPDQHDDNHVDQAIVKRDTRPGWNVFTHYNHRHKLLAWAQGVAATHHIFYHVVLRASVIVPASHQQVSPDERCHLPRLPRVVLERLGNLLGVEMVGRRVRNAREFAEALAAVMEEAMKEAKKAAEQERSVIKRRREAVSS